MISALSPTPILVHPSFPPIPKATLNIFVIYYVAVEVLWASAVVVNRIWTQDVAAAAIDGRSLLLVIVVVLVLNSACSDASNQD
jgi:flagellar biosynthesis protein FlhB